MAQDLGAARVGLQDGRQDADDGGLAGAVRAEQPEDGALCDLEVDAVERLDLAEPLGESFDDDRVVTHASEGPTDS